MKQEAQRVEVGDGVTKEAGRMVELFARIAAAEQPAEDWLEEFRRRYLQCSSADRAAFFSAILHGIEVRKAELQPRLQALMESDESDALAWGERLAGLRQALASPRVKAFHQFANLRGGIRFLLELRSDVLTAQRHGTEDLRLLDQDIANLFNIWFQQGFLFMQQITRDSSFRHILFLKEHDLVHPMANVDEMADRLGEDRLCFALSHLSMPKEIVIFIEVALMKGMSRSMDDIIGAKPEKRPLSELDTAVFYSINNAQNGLGGLGFGKLLIFQVVDLIRNTHPQIETFATLSPVPGFWDRYLKRILSGDDSRYRMKKSMVEGLFSDKARDALLKHYAKQTGEPAEDLCAVLLKVLSGPEWFDDPLYVRHLEKPLTDLVYQNVAKEKSKRGNPLNPVANFHLGNGAMVSRSNVNFGANPTPRGLAESCGVMVNYIYSTPWRRQLRRTVKSLLPWKT